MTESTAPEATRKVFISHATSDAPLARSLTRELAARGLDVSSAEEYLKPGDRWAARLRDAIRKADVCVVIVTHSALNSPYVQLEAAAAIAEAERNPTKRVIPVAVGRDVQPSGLLGSYQWLIRPTDDPNALADALARVVGQIQPIDKEQERLFAREELQRLEAEMLVERQFMIEKEAEGTSRLARTWLQLMAVVLVALGGATVLLNNASEGAPSIVAAVSAVIGVATGYFFGSSRRGSP